MGAGGKGPRSSATFRDDGETWLRVTAREWQASGWQGSHPHARQPERESAALWTVGGGPGSGAALHGASLTLSDFTMGHGDAVIIIGSPLRALASHAFSVAIFT